MICKVHLILYCIGVFFNVIYCVAADITKLQEKKAVMSSSSRGAHPIRQSLSPVIENKSVFSFPEDEMKERKIQKVKKVNIFVDGLLAVT